MLESGEELRRAAKARFANPIRGPGTFPCRRFLNNTV